MSQKDEVTTFFVMCPRGIEALLMQELLELGFSDLREAFCGVHVRAPFWPGLFAINYCSRLASRVLLPLTHFNCYDEKTLYRGMREVNWSDYIKQHQTIAIDVNTHHPRLTHTLFVAQLAKDAICDQLREKLGWRPSVNVQQPDVQINLYIDEKQAIVNIDTSGQPLYKRGYRFKSVEAPLQESLAAALLRIAGFDGKEGLCDPCCGSGTLLIEAAMIASATPAGFFRQQWGFQTLPGYDSIAWRAYKKSVDAKRIDLPQGKFCGIDRSPEAIFAARENVAKAAWKEAITIVQSDFRHYEGPVGAFVMCNPPYGKRLEEEGQLQELYASLGDFLKQRCAKPGRGFILTGSIDLGKSIGLRPQRRHPVNNGGIDARLLEYNVY